MLIYFRTSLVDSVTIDFFCGSGGLLEGLHIVKLPTENKEHFPLTVKTKNGSIFERLILLTKKRKGGKDIKKL